MRLILCAANVLALSIFLISQSSLATGRYRSSTAAQGVCLDCQKKTSDVKEIIDTALRRAKNVKCMILHGGASFYGIGDGFEGKLTASGKPMNPYAMTAAHKTLPKGTKVRVRNKTTGKSVVVKIDDRGPYKKGRIIDLSYEAARRLGIVEKGVAQVEVDTCI